MNEVLAEVPNSLLERNGAIVAIFVAPAARVFGILAFGAI